MIPNVKPSQLYSLSTASIAPASQAAGTVNGAWVAVAPGSKWLLVQLLVGAGAGTFQVDVQQATTVGGAGAKALATAAIAAATTANTDAEVNLDATLDVAGGFAFVRVNLVTTGGAGTLAAVRAAFGPNQFAA